MHTSWYVVADRTKARIFKQRDKRSVLEPVKDFINPEGRLKNQELRTDRQGYIDSTRSSYQPPTEATKHVLERFAKDVAEYLRKANAQGEFDSVVLVAEPSVLGALENELAEPVRKCLRTTMRKDIADAKPEELPKLLEPVFPESLIALEGRQ